MTIEIFLTTVIGTLILWKGSHWKAERWQTSYEHIAGMEEATSPWLAVLLVFLAYYVCVVGLCAWSAWTERLSASSGLDYEVYCVTLSVAAPVD